jgi:hypothetical protein
MPQITTDVDFDLSVDEFLEECNEKEKNELKQKLNVDRCFYDEEQVALQWFRGEFNLKILVRSIGKQTLLDAIQNI